MPGIKDDIDNLISQYSPSSYNEFAQLVDLAKNFGEEALKNKLDVKSKNKINAEDVVNVINNSLRLDKYNSGINNLVEKLFLNVQKRFEIEEHKPRAIPALSQKNELNEDVKQKNQLGFKLLAPWLKNIDEAADPKVRDAAIRAAAKSIANNPNRNMTTQFENAVRADLAHRLEMKLKAMPRPRPSANIRPKEP